MTTSFKADASEFLAHGHQRIALGVSNVAKVAKVVKKSAKVANVAKPL